MIVTYPNKHASLCDEKAGPAKNDGFVCNFVTVQGGPDGMFPLSRLSNISLDRAYYEEGRSDYIIVINGYKTIK